MATMIIPSRAYGVTAKRAAPGPSLWSRFMSALAASRQAEAERIIAQYMGGRWTDSVEREINDRLIRRETLHGF